MKRNAAEVPAAFRLDPIGHESKIGGQAGEGCDAAPIGTNPENVPVHSIKIRHNPVTRLAIFEQCRTEGTMFSLGEAQPLVSQPGMTAPAQAAISSVRSLRGDRTYDQALEAERECCRAGL